MNNLIFSTIAILLSISVSAQELVRDSTYIIATSDSTFNMVTEKTYSNGVTQVSSTPVTPEEIENNIKSFLEFKAREYVYSATSTYDLNRKITLVNNANSNLQNTAGINVLGQFASNYQSAIVGAYQINGDAIALTYQDNEMQWSQGQNTGAVVVYSASVICLKSYFHSKDVLLYKVGGKWINCDGLFLMQ